MKPTHERIDVYERFTAQIIEAIERGAGEWRMPWHQSDAGASIPVNALSRKPYRGINILTRKRRLPSIGCTITFPNSLKRQ